MSGYLLLGERLAADPDSYSAGWNFGPISEERTTVHHFVSFVAAALGDQAPKIRIEVDGPHEAGRLALDITRARELLGWNPLLTLQERAQLTAEWYQADLAGALGPELVDQQIDMIERRWSEAS
ncbi:MAG: hypothetical protein ACO3VI_08420 [Ilumatobacteraceae bacterium]